MGKKSNIFFIYLNKLSLFLDDFLFNQEIKIDL
jgi:hypothetical protein